MPEHPDDSMTDVQALSRGKILLSAGSSFFSATLRCLIPWVTDVKDWPNCPSGYTIIPRTLFCKCTSVIRVTNNIFVCNWANRRMLDVMTLVKFWHCYSYKL